MTTYLELFWAYLQIGLFSIGGGHASIPVAQSMLVNNLGWLSMEEFTNMVTLSEMTPGPFAINSATFVGNKMCGLLGGLVATLGFLVPSIIICSSLYYIIKRFRKVRAVDGFMQGIRPAVTGLISSAGFSLSILALFGASTLANIQADFSFNFVGLYIGLLTFVILRKTKINPIVMILLSGLVGVILYSL